MADRTSQRYKSGPGKLASIRMSATIALSGIVRHWNQTGQKYAGDPDITSRILSSQTWLLWLGVVATYALVCYRLSRQTVRWTDQKQMALLPVPVCMAALFFKISFTSAEAPELLQGITFLRPIV